MDRGDLAYRIIAVGAMVSAGVVMASLVHFMVNMAWGS